MTALPSHGSGHTVDGEQASATSRTADLTLSPVGCEASKGHTQICVQKVHSGCLGEKGEARKNISETAAPVQ